MADSSRYNGWSRLETHAGDRSSIVSAPELERLFQTTPLARLLFAYMDGYLKTWDRNEVGRRALTQVLALRLWQVRHDGRLPGALAELVPSILESLAGGSLRPLGDANQPFGYVRSSGQPLLPLGDFEPLGVQPFPTRTRPVADSWLLYSVGPDLRDDGAKVNDSSHVAKGAGQSVCGSTRGCHPASGDDPRHAGVADQLASEGERPAVFTPHQPKPARGVPRTPRLRHALT